MVHWNSVKVVEVRVQVGCQVGKTRRHLEAACRGLLGGMKNEEEVSAMGAVEKGAKQKRFNHLNLGSHRPSQRGGGRK